MIGLALLGHKSNATSTRETGSLLRMSEAALRMGLCVKAELVPSDSCAYRVEVGGAHVYPVSVTRLVNDVGDNRSSRRSPTGAPMFAESDGQPVSPTSA